MSKRHKEIDLYSLKIFKRGSYVSRLTDPLCAMKSAVKYFHKLIKQSFKMLAHEQRRKEQQNKNYNLTRRKTYRKSTLKTELLSARVDSLAKIVKIHAILQLLRMRVLCFSLTTRFFFFFQILTLLRLYIVYQMYIIQRSFTNSTRSCSMHCHS